MANTDQAGEPSMEDILASIRKIISDEDEADSANAANETTLADDDPVEDFDEADNDRAFEAAESDIFEKAEASADADVFETADADEGTADVFEMADDESVLALSMDAIVDTPDDDGADALDAAEEPDDLAAPAEDDLPLANITESMNGDIDFADEEPAPEPEPEPEPVVAAKAPEPEMPADGSILSNAANESVTAAFSNLANVMLSGNARTLEDLVKEMLRPMLKGWLDENLPPLVERLVRDEIERVSRARR